jgi:hypothetical protein
MASVTTDNNGLVPGCHSLDVPLFQADACTWGGDVEHNSFQGNDNQAEDNACERNHEHCDRDKAGYIMAHSA